MSRHRYVLDVDMQAGTGGSADTLVMYNDARNTNVHSSVTENDKTPRAADGLPEGPQPVQAQGDLSITFELTRQ